MELNKFIKNVADQFEDTDPGEITTTTVYKDLEEWSSMNALAIISMIDEEYGIEIKIDDIMATSTIEDLFNIVKAKY